MSLMAMILLTLSQSSPMTEKPVLPQYLCHPKSTQTLTVEEKVMIVKSKLLLPSASEYVSTRDLAVQKVQVTLLQDLVRFLLSPIT